MLASTVVPTFSAVQGDEDVIHQFDTVIRNLNRWENVKPSQKYHEEINKNTRWLYHILKKYPDRSCAYIMESIRYLPRTSLYFKQLYKAMEQVVTETGCPICAFYLGELHRVGIYSDNKFCTKGSRWYAKAASRGHKKALQRREENEEIRQAGIAFDMPYADPTRPMYVRQAVGVYHKMINKGRYDVAPQLLSYYDAQNNTKALYHLLKELSLKMPENQKILFYKKEITKEYIFYLIKTLLWRGLYLFVLLWQMKYIIDVYYFGEHKTLWQTVCAMYVIGYPITFFFMKTKSVFLFLLDFFTPSQRDSRHWDMFLDCMILSAIF